MSVVLRTATESDAASVLGLIQDLAAYEKEPDAVEATIETVARDLRGDSPARIECILAEIDHEIVGMALYFHNYSTWRGRAGIYLEDLFVKPEFRGRGAGVALMRELGRIAVERDCGRFEWVCLDWNEPSIRFYEAMGARAMKGWTIFRLEGEALERLGEGEEG